MAALRNACSGPFGAMYDAYIERERVSWLVGKLVWGIDTRDFYASMRAIGQARDGETILDVPCGGGVAFRALRREQAVRYIAVDLADEMLARARCRAAQRGLDQIEFIRANMCELPLDDSVADLCLSYSGLHCVARPGAAVAELVRCLRVGGQLIGTMFLSVGTRRQRLIHGLGQRRGELGPMGTREALHGWLENAGVTDITIEPDHGFVLFRGLKHA